MIKRVHWTDNEWLAVARELYRQHPIDQYLRSTSLAGLTRQDFFDAQCCLPEDRRRFSKVVKSLTIIRPKLLEAMAKVREEVDAKNLQKKAEEEQAALEAKAVEAIATQAAQVNIYEAAFAPLIDLIASEVTKRVHALLVSQNQETYVREQTFKPVETKSRTPKFGVVGPLSIQAHELRKAFQDVDFVIVENGQAASTPAQMNNCDKIIGMTDFMSHSIDSALKSRFGDKYHRVTGSTSSVKRLISILLNSIKHEEKTK